MRKLPAWEGRLVPIIGTQAVGLGCGLASVWLVSRLVAPADFGVYGVFVSLATIGATVIHAGPLKFLVRHWGGATDRPALLAQTFIEIGRKVPYLILACIAASVLLAPPHDVVIFGALLIVTALLGTFAQVTQCTLQAAQEHRKDFVLSSTLSVSRSLLPVGLYLVTGLGLVALLGGFVSHAIVGALCAGIYLKQAWTPRRQGHPSPIPEIYRGFQFIGLAAVAWTLSGLGRWVFVKFFGAEAAGYFTLATNVGAILPWMLGVGFLQYAQPLWFAAADRGAAPAELLAATDRVAFAHAAAALLAAALVQVALPWLVGTLVDLRYAAAAEFVFPTACFAISVTTGTFFHTLLMAAKRERDCAKTDLWGALFLVVGTVGTAAAGVAWFKAWLIASPAIPWLVNRTIARRALVRNA